jgi:fumarate reductase flavoprotein subunit
MAEYEADVVIIGSGGAGLCAALTACFGGASVIVLEETRVAGGLSRFSEGLFAVESRWQKKAKIGITVDEAFQRHMNESHWEANPRLVRTFMDKTSDTIDWLEGLGVEFRGVSRIYPEGPLVWHMFKQLAGISFINPLLKRIKSEKGIRVLLQTPARSLVMENGRVAGVVAEDKKGGVIHITCKTVVIASGGYQDNKEWLKKYCKAGEHIGPLMSSKQKGRPIQMAWDAGAEAEGMGAVQAFMLVPGENNMGSHLVHAGMQPYLWVNSRGERFCDEGIVWKFPWAANAFARQPKAEAFCVFDEDTKDYLKERGVLYVIGEFLDPETKLLDLDNEIEQGVSRGNTFCAGSVKELAGMIGAGEKQLQDTIDEYNACCDKNMDFVFGKNRAYLKPVRRSRFYAIKLAFKILITEGGIKINHKTEVVDKAHRVIPGLYAAGCCAGDLIGATYIMSTTGGSASFAANSGRMAGESILTYIAK